MGNLVFEKPSIQKNDGSLERIKSNPVPIGTAITWLRDFRDDAPIIFRNVDGQDVAVNGFSFDVSHVAEIISGLNPDNHEVHLGFAKRPDGSHTLILGAIKLTRDADGNVTDRKFLHNATTKRVFDYCDPCPPACPDSSIAF